MKKSNYYRLIPMNIDDYKIDDLLEEIKENKKIEWKNGSKNGKYAQQFSKNDIVYIYCRNLSDGSNRILFRAIVDSADNKNEYSFDPINKIKSVFIKDLKAIAIKNKEKFSKEKLLNKYDLSINQTKQILASFEDYNKYLENKKSINSDLYGKKDKESISKYLKHLKLIEDLEKAYNNEEKYSLQKAKDFFNEEILCECCNILGFSKKEARYRTFKKTNGFVYYEVHHLLMQNILSMKNKNWFKENTWYRKDNEEDKKMITSEFNTINLCPVCHREFHYGEFTYNSNIKNKKELIKKIMTIHKFNENLKKCGKNDSEIKEIKNYILKQYIKDYENEH